MVKTVRLPKPASDVLLLHIELKRVSPTIWRRFVVSQTISLGKLHKVIQVVMGWSDYHLHEFEIAGEHYGLPDPDVSLPTVNADASTPLLKALSRKRTFNYLYDFGDDWEHRIKVEKKLPAIAFPQVPFCIDGANACSPEDVGGGPG